MHFPSARERDKTGIPDPANGPFEVSGPAQQYMTYSTLIRMVHWKGPIANSPEITRVANGRERKPQDNLRARNRI